MRRDSRMRMKRTLWLCIVCVLAGCRLHNNFTQTVITEPLHFHEYLAEKTERKRYRRLAEDVYESVCRGKSKVLLQTPYAEGFLDGFVEHMVAGGTVEAPFLPPRKYWNQRHQNLSGHRAAHEWFSGYEHGAMSARDGGYREMITIPTLPQHYSYLEQQSQFADKVEPMSPNFVDVDGEIGFPSPVNGAYIGMDPEFPAEPEEAGLPDDEREELDVAPPVPDIESDEAASEPAAKPAKLVKQNVHSPASVPANKVLSASSEAVIVESGAPPSVPSSETTERVEDQNIAVSAEHDLSLSEDAAAKSRDIPKVSNSEIEVGGPVVKFVRRIDMVVVSADKSTAEDAVANSKQPMQNFTVEGWKAVPMSAGMTSPPSNETVNLRIAEEPKAIAPELSDLRRAVVKRAVPASPTKATSMAVALKNLISSYESKSVDPTIQPVSHEITIRPPFAPDSKDIK